MTLLPEIILSKALIQGRLPRNRFLTLLFPKACSVNLVCATAKLTTIYNKIQWFIFDAPLYYNTYLLHDRYNLAGLLAVVWAALYSSNYLYPSSFIRLMKQRLFKERLHLHSR